MRRHLTYANVMSTIAVFVAVSIGGAYAADKITSKDIAKDAVTSKAIKNKSVKGKDVKDKTLTGADVKDGSIGSADLAPIRIVTPHLGNGGQNDCLWTDGAAGEPAIEPVSYRVNGYGEVNLSGIVQASDGPGGDGDCNGGPPDAIEDSTIFVIGAGDAPAKSSVLIQPGGATGVFIVGTNGLVSGSSSYPPGAVLGAVSANITLDGIDFLAAGATAGATTNGGRPDRISPARLRKLIG